MKRQPLLKQFGDLKSDDFAKHPVWASVHTLDYDEPWYDDADEETFPPWPGALPVSPDTGMFLVRAKLTVADCRVFTGFVTPQQEGEPFNLGTIQPHLFLPSGQWCSFWDGMVKRPEKARTAIYKEIGQETQAIFPIQFSVEKGLAFGQVAGSIPGFCWRSKEKVQIYQ